MQRCHEASQRNCGVATDDESSIRMKLILRNAEVIKKLDKNRKLMPCRYVKPRQERYELATGGRINVSAGRNEKSMMKYKRSEIVKNRSVRERRSNNYVKQKRSSKGNMEKGSKLQDYVLDSDGYATIDHIFFESEASY